VHNGARGVHVPLTHSLRKEKLGWVQRLPVSRLHSTSNARAAGPVPVPRSAHAPTVRIGREPAVVLCTPIRAYGDILEARKQGRALASELGFSSIDCTLVVTAISELARNIVLYAGEGEIRLSRERHLGANGITITACDHGPGIRDLRNALQEGGSTLRGLGLGLPGVRRIMDEFDIQSRPTRGTTVTVKKWKAT